MLLDEIMQYLLGGVSLQTRVPAMSLQDMWDADKERIRRGLPNLGIDLSGLLPTNENAAAIIVHDQSTWEEPPKPIVLTEKYLDDRLAVLAPLVEKVAGTTFDTIPSVEALSSTEYLPRINEVNRGMDELVGISSEELLSPPGSLFSPYQNTIIVPNTFIIRYTSGSPSANCVHQDYCQRTFPWDADHFDYMLVCQLSRALYRQIRGELGDGYVGAMRKLGPIHSKATVLINGVFEQRVTEKISDDLPVITGAVLSAKIVDVWSSRIHQQVYLALCGVEEEKALYQAACADFLFASPGRHPVVSFQRDHPTFVKNLNTFTKPYQPSE
jgi:hypothetical protein